MTSIADVVSNLIGQTAFMNLTFGNLIMILVAFVFLFLAIKMGFEPLLLVPIAFGMLLVNIYPDIMIAAEEASNGTPGLLHVFYILDEWSVLPSLIFLGVGAMTDFGPLIANPKSFLMGAAAQLGIYVAYFLAIFMGFKSPLSEELTVRLLFSWQENWASPDLWVPLRWQHIPICLWFLLSSRQL